MKISFEINTQEDFEKLRAFFATTQWPREERREEGVLPLFPPLPLPPIPPIPITPYNPPLSEEEKREEKTPHSHVRGELREFGYYGNVRLSEEEYDKLNDKFGFQKTQDMIEHMDYYIGEDPARQKKYAKRNHYLTLLNWERKDSKDKKPQSKSFGDMLKDMQEQTPVWDIEI